MASTKSFQIRHLDRTPRSGLGGVRAAAGRFGAFLSETAANVAVSFALMLAPLTAAVGGALDYTRAVMIGTEIQAALDSGVLAAASLTQDRDPETVVRAYVQAALADHGEIVDSLDITVRSQTSLNSRTVSADASVSLKTIMLGVVGIGDLTVFRTSEALEEVRDVEISLVLDVSGSMSGSKIAALRDAASEFLDVVLDTDRTDRTSVSVIPYNGGVRLPGAVNRGLFRGLNASGCPDHGTDYPVVIPHADLDTLSPLEWNGNPQLGHNHSSHCPEMHMESSFLQNDKAELQALVSGLDASGNTGLDVATAWGARALDPSWRAALPGEFADRPAAYDDPDTIKVLVVMTDGAATAQSRTERRRGRWRRYELYPASTARDNMLEACSYAKDHGVVVYTIAFQLSGQTNRDLMRNCASRAQTYYEVESMDISAAFAAIAADINQLRISK
ncbi:pilus assembly protein [Marinicauda algicola]|uniref:Pilus assembly protein n=1 Tax=Marinicauda algicola TaxID=2029849 RepID=A0A4S2H3B6_9PROT|nr:TadE/TadG family type IV pilus assembly protein [Marinicauda algicola]TGY90105.1 pilus assembly protein [Marinicauda algicola]